MAHVCNIKKPEKLKKGKHLKKTTLFLQIFIIKMSETVEKDKETDVMGEKTKLDYDEKTKNGELAVKVICLGDSAVGKSK